MPIPNNNPAPGNTRSIGMILATIIIAIVIMVCIAFQVSGSLSAERGEPATGAPHSSSDSGTIVRTFKLGALQYEDLTVNGRKYTINPTTVVSWSQAINGDFKHPIPISISKVNQTVDVGDGVNTIRVINTSSEEVEFIFKLLPGR